MAFDEYAGESGVKPETMVEVEGILKEKGVLEEDAATGSWVVDLKKHGGKKHGMCIIRDRSGSSTYLLRDLAAVVERERSEGDFEKMVYVVQSDQHVIHFQRLGKLLELMGMEALAVKLLHVQFGEMIGAEKIVEEGDAGLLESVLEKSRLGVQASLDAHPDQSALLTENLDLEIAGINALIAQELATRRTTDYKFDIQKLTSFDSGSGLDLLFWHAKLCSLLKENEGIAGLSLEDSKEALTDEDQNNLLRLLVQYPDHTQVAYNSLESAPVVTFLFTLVSQLEACLESPAEPEEDPQEVENGDGATEQSEEVVEKSEAVAEKSENVAVKKPLTPAEVRLYEATKVVLENGIKLLGMRI